MKYMNLRSEARRQIRAEVGIDKYESTDSVYSEYSADGMTIEERHVIRYADMQRERVKNPSQCKCLLRKFYVSKEQRRKIDAELGLEDPCTSEEEEKNPGFTHWGWDK